MCIEHVHNVCLQNETITSNFKFVHDNTNMFREIRHCKQPIINYHDSNAVSSSQTFYTHEHLSGTTNLMLVSTARWTHIVCDRLSVQVYFSYVVYIVQGQQSNTMPIRIEIFVTNTRYNVNVHRYSEQFCSGLKTKRTLNRCAVLRFCVVCRKLRRTYSIYIEIQSKIV